MENKEAVYRNQKLGHTDAHLILSTAVRLQQLNVLVFVCIVCIICIIQEFVCNNNLATSEYQV